MPQHPARHHAPADQLVPLTDPHVGGEIPGHAHRLADLDVDAGPPAVASSMAPITVT